MMQDAWDGRFPFTPDEVALFSALHQKATKFPPPPGIQPASTRPETVLVSPSTAPLTASTIQDCQMSELGKRVDIARNRTDQAQTLLRNLDLLLEAHKQLRLIVGELGVPAPAEPDEPSLVPAEPDELSLAPADSSLTPKLTPTQSHAPSHAQSHALTQSHAQSQSQSHALSEPDNCTELKRQLALVRARIHAVESCQSAINTIMSCALPGLTVSPSFCDALRLLVPSVTLSAQDSLRMRHALERAGELMRRCWDNAMVAMARVLDSDVQSIESYLDSPACRDISTLLLRPLLANTVRSDGALDDTRRHFLSEYVKLRENAIRFIIDERLNEEGSERTEESKLSGGTTSTSVSDRILHMIERARLMMVVETRQFDSLFSLMMVVETRQFDTLFSPAETRPHANRILETAGNLMFSRIAAIVPKLSVHEHDIVARFIHPLMQSILIGGDEADPFGLFLKLLADRFFPVYPVVQETDAVMEV